MTLQTEITAGGETNKTEVLQNQTSLFVQSLSTLLNVSEDQIVILQADVEEQTGNARRRSVYFTTWFLYQIVLSSSASTNLHAIKSDVDLIISSNQLVNVLNTVASGFQIGSAQLTASQFAAASTDSYFSGLALSISTNSITNSNTQSTASGFFDFATLQWKWTNKNVTELVWYSLQMRAALPPQHTSALFTLEYGPPLAAQPSIHSFAGGIHALIDTALPWRQIASSQLTSHRIPRCLSACSSLCLCPNSLYEFRVVALMLSETITSETESLAVPAASFPAAAINVSATATNIHVAIADLSSK